MALVERGVLLRERIGADAQTVDRRCAARATQQIEKRQHEPPDDRVADEQDPLAAQELLDVVTSAERVQPTRERERGRSPTKVGEVGDIVMPRHVPEQARARAQRCARRSGGERWAAPASTGSVFAHALVPGLAAAAENQAVARVVAHELRGRRASN